jgi:GDPmannose 4,6-dehydratase
MKKALIFGITGQDGSYLADFLVKKGYDVSGTYRRTSHRSYERLEAFNLLDKTNLIPADLLDQTSLNYAVKQTTPDEIYNLAAQSFVGVSFTQPILTSEITGLGAIKIFEAVKEFSPHSKIYQASSSEMFGNTDQIKNEGSRLSPASPYGIAKVFAHKSAQHYRQAHNMFISSGILFNHESPHRGLEFVTRKITSAIANIISKKQDKLILGNLKAKRDWGFAGDYVKAMWLMLQQPTADDYVIATGKSYSVEDFLEKSFEYSGLGDWKNYVETSEKYMRPSDISNLIGDASKAKKELNWEYEMSFEKLVKLMVDSDIAQNK